MNRRLAVRNSRGRAAQEFRLRSQFVVVRDILSELVDTHLITNGAEKGFNFKNVAMRHGSPGANKVASIEK